VKHGYIELSLRMKKTCAQPSSISFGKIHSIVHDYTIKSNKDTTLAKTVMENLTNLYFLSNIYIL